MRVASAPRPWRCDWPRRWGCASFPRFRSGGVAAATLHRPALTLTTSSVDVVYGWFWSLGDCTLRLRCVGTASARRNSA
jgi:hypothetical protein